MPIATENPTGDLSNVSPSTFHIAIIGGGIGGLCAALSLATYSPGLTNITVYEQASEYSEIGAGVAIGVSAGRVLKKLGVWDAVNAISGERHSIHRSTRRWDNDELIVDVASVNRKDNNDEVGQLWLHRAEFLEVLHSEIRRIGRAKLETSKRAVKLEVWELPNLDLCNAHIRPTGSRVDCFHQLCRWHHLFCPSRYRL
jgi:salicylate hydroxylase